MSHQQAFDSVDTQALKKKTGLLLLISIILLPFLNGVISQPASSKSLLDLRAVRANMD